MRETHTYKDMLEKEMQTIETELKTVGHKRVYDHSTWEAVEPEVGRDRADETEVADNIEEFETNNGIVLQLEKQLTDVKNALAKIEKRTFGVCEVGGEEIEEDRLMANPSARTCKKHMNA
jgi:RNA polymerase-binding transcription factor DksA